MKQILKAGIVYFTIVFAVGFVFGTIRTLWVVPFVGVRMAELAETPIMVAASILAAQWVSRRVGFPVKWPNKLLSGLVALGLMLFAEFGFVLWVRGLTIRQYFAIRDPVSGTAYFVALVVFAILPLFMTTRVHQG